MSQITTNILIGGPHNGDILTMTNGISGKELPDREGTGYYWPIFEKNNTGAWMWEWSPFTKVKKRGTDPKHCALRSFKTPLITKIKTLIKTRKNMAKNPHYEKALDLYGWSTLAHHVTEKGLLMAIKVDGEIEYLATTPKGKGTSHSNLQDAASALFGEKRYSTHSFAAQATMTRKISMEQEVREKAA